MQKPLLKSQKDFSSSVRRQSRRKRGETGISCRFFSFFLFPKMATCFPQNGHEWGRGDAGELSRVEPSRAGPGPGQHSLTHSLTPARWLSRRTVGNEAAARCPQRPSRPRRLQPRENKTKRNKHTKKPIVNRHKQLDAAAGRKTFVARGWPCLHFSGGVMVMVCAVNSSSK